MGIMKQVKVKQGCLIVKKCAASTQRKERFRMLIAFQFRVLVYPSPDKKNAFVAHCLELDVIGQGKSVEAAVGELLEVIEIQIENSKSQKVDPFFPAPKEIWETYQRAKETKRQLSPELMDRIIENANKQLGHRRPILDMVVPSQQIPDEMLTASV
jgi:predicted RNase H-like HicB family nuclease